MDNVARLNQQARRDLFEDSASYRSGFELASDYRRQARRNTIQNSTTKIQSAAGW